MKLKRIIHSVLLVLGLSVLGLITDEEIIVSKDKVATVKRWLDS